MTRPKAYLHKRAAAAPKEKEKKERERNIRRDVEEPCSMGNEK